MKPLIKWPGGKTSEFKHIQNLIPPYQRYIEPFFGGGAVYFSLPPGKACINDKSSNLIDFYRMVKDTNTEFQQALNTYNHYWQLLGELFALVYPALRPIYLRYRPHNPAAAAEAVIAILDDKRELLLRQFSHPILLDTTSLLRGLQTTIADKVKRMMALEIQMQQSLTEQDLRSNLETGCRSGFYMHFRTIYNDIALGRTAAQALTAEEKAANFYFVREFCYGSMFRYNRKGEFNIPYGGIAYNSKNFKKKIDRLFAAETTSYFSNTDIYNTDFETFLQSLDLKSDDFIFLDPPYDSDFSDYDGAAFGPADQVRLANFLGEIPAKFILVIKHTDFIYDLYSHHRHLDILTFDKQYTYNVRSRNNRQASHLIITNC